jgi:hypothetical protein
MYFVVTNLSVNRSNIIHMSIHIVAFLLLYTLRVAITQLVPTLALFKTH